MTGAGKDDKAFWNGAKGRHTLSGFSTVLAQARNKPEVVIAQIHDRDDDHLELMWSGSRTDDPADAFWTVRIDGKSDGRRYLRGWALGKELHWSIALLDGHVTVALNEHVVYDQDKPFTMHDLFFKAGCYAQSHSRQPKATDDGDEFFEVQLRDLTLTHAKDLT
jgi:hypothetical protein